MERLYRCVIMVVLANAYRFHSCRIVMRYEKIRTFAPLFIRIYKTLNMKRITLLLSIVFLMLLAPVFGQTIDFTKRYTIDNIRGIAWQPGTDMYSYIDDDRNLMLVNPKNGKETVFLAAASQKAHEISSPYGYEWLEPIPFTSPATTKP